MIFRLTTDDHGHFRCSSYEYQGFISKLVEPDSDVIVLEYF